MVVGDTSALDGDAVVAAVAADTPPTVATAVVGAVAVVVVDGWEGVVCEPAGVADAEATRFASATPVCCDDDTVACIAVALAVTPSLTSNASS